MRMLLLAALMFLLAGCPKDGIAGDDGGDDVTGDGGPTGPDADVGDTPCDMSGVWIAEQHTVSVALATDQLTTNYYYYEIEQTGDRFTIVDAMNCGFVVDGTTTVTLGDATLEALARQEMAGPNRQGNYFENGGQCEFSLDRSYNLRGANKATYLTDHWNVGDPDKALSTFPALPSAPPGMEDWDGDNMDGITLTSGLGPRYVAQRDWNQHAGTTETFASQFGGEGVIVVQWDSQEGISTQTAPLLRTTATPSGDGWARYARAPQLEIIDGDDLQSCRNVQQLAQQIWP
jgi:hypothetical protein